MKSGNTNLSIFFFLIFVTASILFIVNPLNAQTKPVLFFSDLTWGPKTGWEQSSTKGAAVTIWGENFDASGTLTVCGQTLSSSDSNQVAEWAATTNPTVARGLQRITFWLNSSMTTGAGTISVTAGGQTSNTLPFTITSTGTIYFVAADGNDSTYNGLYSTRTGHSGADGPFRNVLKMDPENGLGDTQFIIYVRGNGNYTTKDPIIGYPTYVGFYGPYGSPTTQKALIAYPTEAPSFSLATTSSSGFDWINDDPGAHGGAGKCSYFTWSKLTITGAGANGAVNGIQSFGDYNRVIGNNFLNIRPSAAAWTGVTFVTNSHYVYIYGNIYSNCGYDSYMHNIYIKSQNDYRRGAPFDPTAKWVYVGYNEIISPYASDNHCGAIFLSTNLTSATPTEHIYIFGNYFHGTGTCTEYIYSGDTYAWIDDVYIYNNIFTGGNASGTGESVFLYAGSRNFYIWNNSFYQNLPTGSYGQVGLYGGHGNSDYKRVYFKNNIFYSNPNQPFVYMEGGWPADYAYSDYDLYYNPGGSPTLPSITSVTHSVTSGNPLFTNASGGDFSIQSGSPAKDAGTSAVSTMVTTDYIGTSRPQNSLYDIGPYEYLAGGGGNTPPAAPTSLRIQSQ